MSLYAAVVLFLLPLCFTGHAFVIDGVYGPVDWAYQSEPFAALKAQYGIGAPRNITSADAFSQFIPWREAVRASLARGEWPLWNPYSLCGHLLAGNAQSAAYSPFTLIACLLPAAKSFVYTASIAFFLAALSAFLFLREIECSEAAALVGAAGWMFATSVAQYILVPMGFAWTMFPFVLASAHRVVHAPGVRAWAMLTTVLTLIVLAGHPESLLLAVITGSLYALFEMLRARIRPWRPMATALAAGAVTLAVCAIHLLPFAEAVPQSSEYAYKSQYWGNAARGASTQVMTAMLTTDAFPYLYLRKWVSPERPLLPAESWAVGSLLLGLALFAIWRKPSARTWFFAALFLFSVANTVLWAPVANAMQRFPLLRMTHNERLACAAAFVLCALAAIGVDAISEHRRAAAITLAIVFGALVIGSVWVRRAIVVAPFPNDYGRFAVFAELFFVACAALLLFSRVPLRFIAPSLLVLLAAQRMLTGGGLHSTLPSQAAYPRIALFDAIRNVREPFRIVGVRTAFIPATNTLYGMEDPRGYEGLTYRQFEETWKLWSHRHFIWFNRVDDLTRPILSFMNVRYAITSDRDPIPDGWRRIASQSGAMLLENTRVIERVFIPRRVVIGLPDSMELFGMQEQADFRDRAWISGEKPEGERENGPGRVTLRRRSMGGSYLLAADMQRDGWIVISDTAWKGWRAYVDGRRVKLRRANLAFNAIHVGPGHHVVRVVYWPESFVIGRSITFSTLLLIAVWASLRMYSRPRARTTSAHPVPSPSFS